MQKQIQQVRTWIRTKDNAWQWWFWSVILLMAPLGAALEQGSWLEAIVFRSMGLITKMGASYLAAYYIIPQLLFRRRYFAFLLWTILSIIFFCYLARIINVHIAEPLFGYGEQESLLQLISEFDLTIAGYFDRVYGTVVLFLIFKFGYGEMQGQRKLERVEKEKAKAELGFLKAQIHPHFLFNTLNNLYVLTLEKSDEAPRVVERLAAILDYLLYQSNVPKVPISKEVQLLEDYIGLESLRYDDRLTVNFTRNIIDNDTKVAPLLLLSPVENAFKHGASGTAESTWVNIDLSVNEQQLHLRVANSKSSQMAKDERNYRGGIGLQNVRSQLALIYPDRHDLAVKEDADTYTVDLTLQL